MFRISRLITASLVIGFAVWCVLSVRSDFAQMSFAPLWKSWNLIVLAMTLTFLNYGLRVSRWRWYLTCFGHFVPRWFSALTYVAGFAFTLSPGKLGELVRARYYTAIGIPFQNIMAAFFAERLTDLLALLLLTLLLLRELSHYKGLIWAAAILIVISIAMVIALPSQPVTDFFESSPLIPKRVSQSAASALTSLRAARSLLSPQQLLIGLLIALAAWGLEGLGLRVLGSIFFAPLGSASTAVGIYVIAVLIGALSFLPGGVGSTEAVMTVLLESHGYSLGAALLTTLTCRITTLWFGVGLGWVAVATLRYAPQHEIGG